MRAAAGLHAGDAFRRQRAGARKIFGIPFGVDVVGDGGDLVFVAQLLAQRIHQRGLAGADRAADADAQGAARILMMPQLRTAACIGFRGACWRDRRGTLRCRCRRASPRARARGRRDDRLKRGQHPLAVGLPERDEPHAGRNEIGRDGMQKGVQRRLSGNAVAGGGDRDRDRIGDGAAPGAGKRSSASHGQAARVASRRLRPARSSPDAAPSMARRRRRVRRPRAAPSSSPPAAR